MTENKTNISVKEFFLQIGVIGALYASLVALVLMLFRVINVAYPKVNYGDYYYSQSISFQVATLIVFFPVFLLLSWFLQKSLANESNSNNFPLRKWLSYLTLFIAGAVIAGNLVSVIYTFLDGQELTKAFLLKAFVLLIVSGGVFIYFLQDIRNQLSTQKRNIWRIISTLFILGSIILAFSVMGSPMSQRLTKYDIQKINDLQSIQWQVVNYYQQKENLPDSLGEMNDPIGGWREPLDPQSKQSYEYEKTGALSFNLCANFNKESLSGINPEGYLAMPSYAPSPIGKGGENWGHPTGRNCFARTIDPELYPSFKERVR
ncbi:MAG: DUF5671 domain-containing protein [bacterium]|nr:DUF5671 domain-containing protein [bacterium]